VDYLNNTYISCRLTNSKAFFVNEGDIFYFTHFEGDKRSLLYYFYLGSYKVIFGFYHGLMLEDHFPLNVLTRGPLRYIQDFLAPFYLFTKSVYKLEYNKSTDHISKPEIKLHSSATLNLSFKSVRQISFELLFDEDRLEKFIIIENKKEPSEWVRSSDT